MRILGIDPGSRVTGFGVIDHTDAGEQQYIVSGAIRTDAKKALPLRIYTLTTSVQELITTYIPDAVAIEKVFINTNFASSLILCEARGAILGAAVLKNLPIYEYSALQVKKAVVGNGKAAKEQVQHMVKELLNLSGKPGPDAADALAAALAHIFSSVCRTLSAPKAALPQE